MKKLLCLIVVLGMLVWAGIAIVGCGSSITDWLCDDDCNEEYDDKADKYDYVGDCFVTEWSDGTWCNDCWWWESGASHTFCQWDSCGCDVTDYFFTPITSLTGDAVEDQGIIVFENKDDNIIIKVSIQRELKKSIWVIPFAISEHLMEEPLFSVLTDNGIYDCQVEYTIHDSGRTTGLIYVPSDMRILTIYFNKYEIDYTPLADK